MHLGPKYIYSTELGKGQSSNPDSLNRMIDTHTHTLSPWCWVIQKGIRLIIVIFIGVDAKVFLGSS